MNDIDDKEAIERLRVAGCTASEIERLCRLRRNYVVDAVDQTLRDHRYPAFVRWLVRLVQEGTPTSVPWW